MSRSTHVFVAVVAVAVAASASSVAASASSVAGVAGGRAGSHVGYTAGALARDRWRVLARSPIGAPAGASVTWDGSELLEVGGGDAGGGQSRVLRQAAAFDPVTRRWRKLAAVPSVVLAADAATAWTGSKLFVFGGAEPPGPPSSRIGGLYDPASNSWTLTPPAPVTLPSESKVAVWSGSRVILAAIGERGTSRVLRTAEYDPEGNGWRSLSLALPTGHEPVVAEMVATNHGVLLWSLWSRSKRISANGFRIYSGVDVFALANRGWRRVATAWPQNRTVDQPLFTGSRVLLGANQIWCGTCSHPPPFNANGWSVNPMTLTVEKLPHGPLDDLGPQILWSGNAVISLNSDGEISGPEGHVAPGDIAFLDPISRRWYRGQRAPHAPGPLPAIWDGGHLLVLDLQGRVLSYGS